MSASEGAAAEQQQQQQQEAPSVSKAALGAKLAAEASLHASSILASTRESITCQGLQDLKLPRIPVSPSGYEAEQRRSVAADIVVPSPYCSLPPKPAYPVPTAATQAVYDSLLRAGLKAIKQTAPLTMADATALDAVLNGPGGGAIERLDLSRAVDEFAKPAVPQDLLAAAVAQVEAEVGPESDEANVEKLQALMEKAKQEYTGYEAAVKFLAERRLDRFDTVIRTLLKNYTVTELDLSHNHLGATHPESGRAFYQPLRRLGKLLDDTSKIAAVDLSGNAMGPVGVGIIAKAMCKNITVHSLNLSGNEISQPDAPDEEEDPEQEDEDPTFGDLAQSLEALAEMLKKNKFLKVLSLRNNGIKGEVDLEGEDDGAETPFGKFIEPLRKYHRLEILDLSGNELGPGGAKMLAGVLGGNHSVRTLDLSDNGIGIQGLGFVSKLLQNNQFIRTLQLHKNDMAISKKKKARRQAMATLAEFGHALKGNQTLTSLNLSGHHFGTEACLHILEGLEASRITELHFDSNDLCGTTDSEEADTQALEMILAAIKRVEAPLKDLSIAGNRLLAKGAKLLAESGAICSLASLNIARNVIGNDGFVALMSAIASGERINMLAELDISHNSISDAAALARTLPKASSLKQLNASSNRFGDEAADFVDLVTAVGAADGSMLRAINLASNNVGNDESESQALVSLCARAAPPFAQLNLMDNPKIDLATTTEMLRALSQNQGLRGLQVSSQAGDRHALAEAAVECLKTNTHLVDLDLCFPVDTDDEPLTKLKDKLLLNALQGVSSDL